MKKSFFKILFRYLHQYRLILIFFAVFIVTFISVFFAYGVPLEPIFYASNDNFSIVFAAIGVKHDEAFFFKEAFKKAGVQNKVAMYINYADDPIMERIITPRCALTAAEYLAFEENQHVLVIMTDITSYGEALREEIGRAHV